MLAHTRLRNTLSEHFFTCPLLESTSSSFVDLIFKTKNLFINPFLTNVPLMDKPGCWFLLANCFKNTCRRVTF